MNICVLNRYKVKITSKYSLLVNFGNDEFEEHYEESEKVYSGDELLYFIEEELSDDYIFELDTQDNKIRIEYFNYNTGEGGTTIYEIEEIGENK